MNDVKLYIYGRQTVQGKWRVNQRNIVNRLYYVNSGSAVISTGSAEHTLTAGRIYIIPQCKEFQPLSATDFDHTYFNYFSSRILQPDKIIEFDGSLLSA